MHGPWQLGGLSTKELAKRVWKEMGEDAVFDAGAALGYYFMLALFPLMIFLISMLATIQALDLANIVMGTLRTAMPAEAYDLIGKEMLRVLNDSGGGLLTLGALGTLWAASSGVVSLLDGLNRAYDVEETRGLIRQRVIAIGLTVALALLIIVGAVALMAGDKIFIWIAEQSGLEWLSIAGTIANYLVGLGAMFMGLEVIYYFGPNVKGQKWKWVSPGSLVGIAIFILASVLFSVYLRVSGGYAATYGSLGAVIVLMLWLYFLGLAIMVGGEVNAEIAAAALERGSRTAPKIAVEKEPATDAPPKVGSPKPQTG